MEEDISMYYKGNVIIPVSFTVRDLWEYKTYAYKDENDEIRFGFDTQHIYQGEPTNGYKSIAEMVEAIKEEIKSMNPSAESFGVKKPYVEE